MCSRGNSTSLLAVGAIHGLGSSMTMSFAMAYAACLSLELKEGRYRGTMTLATFSGSVKGF